MRIRKQAKRWVCMILLVLLCGAGTAGAAGSTVPILMYHHLVTDGEINDMTITGQRFREDMEFLKTQGYTTLVSSDLVAIASGSMPMPEKPVMITFDDGYESNYLLAYPILKELEQKATISLITIQLRDTYNEQYKKTMSWQQVKEMYQSGLIDFGSHTHDLHNRDSGGSWVKGRHNGIQRRSGETQADYLTRVGDDIATSVRAIESRLGNKVLYFSYPLGATDEWFGQILVENGIAVSTTTLPETASIANGLFSLPRYRITMDDSVSSILGQSMQAVSYNETIQVDGQARMISRYRIGGAEYAKVRDVAAALSGSPYEFAVSEKDGVTTLALGAPYQVIGGEQTLLAGGVADAKPAVFSVTIGDETHTVDGCRVGGESFVDLQALLGLMDLGVTKDTQGADMITALPEAADSK